MKPLFLHCLCALLGARIGRQAAGCIGHLVECCLRHRSRRPAAARAHRLRPAPQRACLRTLAVLLAATLGSSVQAVVLGTASARSNLGQPLVAEIQVLGGDTDTLAAALASAELHQRHGVPSPRHDLGRIDVRVVATREGQHVIRVTSERPVHEPILHLLLDARDDRGHIVRKLALLLDPALPRDADGAAARTHASLPAIAPAAALARAEQPAAARKAGQTRARPGAAPRPRATARGRTTPHAARSRQRGAQAVRRASAESSARPAAHAPAKGADREAQAHSATPETPAPAAPARSADALPAQDAAASAAVTDLRPPAEHFAAGSTPSDSGAWPDTTSADAPMAGIGVAQAATRAQATPDPEEAHRVAASLADPGMRGLLLGTAAALLLLAGLVALRARRRRQHGVAAEPDSELMLTENHESLNFGAPSEPAWERAGALSASAAARVTTTQFQDRHPQDGLGALEAEEDIDPLAEADVYIAYGRTDQAKAILEDAVHHHPQRAALHLKLLSIHRSQSDALAFKERARTLALLTGQRGWEWHEACEMGQSLMPGDSLFVASEVLPLSGRTAAAGLPEIARGAEPAGQCDFTHPGDDGATTDELRHASPMGVEPPCDTDAGTLVAGADPAAQADVRPDLELFGPDEIDESPRGADAAAPAAGAVQEV